MKTRLIFFFWLAMVPVLVFGKVTSVDDGDVVHGVVDKTDWAKFMKPLDLVWTKLPTTWTEGPFLGNGMLGMVVRKSNENELTWEVGRADVQDERDPALGNDLFNQPRLAPGVFLFKTNGKILGCDWRLDLWNAEFVGTVTTSEGELKIRSYVPAGRLSMVIVAEVEATAGEKEVTWEWMPFEAISPRQLAKGRSLKNYQQNEKPVVSERDGLNFCVQKLDRGETATVWKVERSAMKQRLVCSIAHTMPEFDADEAAAKSVNDARAVGEETLIEAHRDWWHAWYPKSFLSLTDNYWTSFYWIQMYKLASATRSDGVLLDLQGPWAQRVTPWPGTWTNLNIQLTYWPCYVGNRMDIADSLRLNMRKYRQNLIENVGEAYREDSAGIGREGSLRLTADTEDPLTKKGAEIGSLPWICHNLWWQYRVTMDDAMLREDVYPILRRAINYYLHFTIKGADGRFHLPETYSPEYGTAPDCNYDLALLKWGCETLLWSNDRLKLNDPLAVKWREVAGNLVDYPKDGNGFMIGKDMPFAKSHRHFSHMFMIWPLRLLDDNDPATNEIAQRSVRHWQSMKGRLQGYSYTGGGSLLASVGDADAAYDIFQRLRGRLEPNSMYKESGPVIETPLSGAQTIHDFLLQSVVGEVRVFPAMPQALPDAVFRDFRGEGAFLVSGEYKDGGTRWIRVKSLAGEPLKLRAKFATKPEISGVEAEDVVGVPSGWDIKLEMGGEVLLKLPEAVAEFKPLAVTSGEENPFGLR